MDNVRPKHRTGTLNLIWMAEQQLLERWSSHAAIGAWNVSAKQRCADLCANLSRKTRGPNQRALQPQLRIVRRRRRHILAKSLLGFAS